MRIVSEDIILMQVVAWLRQCTDLLFMHPANERLCSPQQGALLKRKGVVSGAPDLIIFRRCGQHVGLMIELKTKLGRVTPNQAKFLTRAREEGWATFVCHDAQAAIMLIKSVYELPETTSFEFDTLVLPRHKSKTAQKASSDAV